MNKDESMPTMDDLYPGGRGYHDAHGPYIAAVAAALDAAGITTVSHFADANDPRDGAIELHTSETGVCRRVSSYDEVAVCWQEERGWWVLTVDRYDEPKWTGKGGYQTDSRQVYELGVAIVASPASVVLAVAEWAGLPLELDDDGHPDADFPGHEFDEDDVPLELALRHYAEGGTTRG